MVCIVYIYTDFPFQFYVEPICNIAKHTNYEIGSISIESIGVFYQETNTRMQSTYYNKIQRRLIGNIYQRIHRQYIYWNRIRTRSIGEMYR